LGGHVFAGWLVQAYRRVVGIIDGHTFVFKQQAAISQN
jgi:hypothetical protein